MLRHAIGAIVALAVVAVMVFSAELLGGLSLYLPLAALLLVGSLLGRGPAVLATLVVGVGVLLVLLEPPFGLHEALERDRELMRLVTFVPIALLVALVGSSHRRARLRLVALTRSLEQRVRDTRGRFERTARAVPGVLYDYEPGGEDPGFRYVSPQVRDLVELEPEAVLQDAARFWALVDPEDVRAIQASVAKAKAMHAPVFADARLTTPSGKKKWVRLSSVPNPEEPRIWSGIMVDVTEEKRVQEALRAAREELEAKVKARTEELAAANEALRASEQHFRTLADAMPQLVWMSRADGRNEYCNARFFQFAEVAPEEASDSLWERLIHPDDFVPMISRWNRCVRTGEPFEFEFRMRGKFDGTYRWFLARAVPVFGKDGSIERWFGTSTDIQEQRESQEARAHADAVRESERQFRTLAEAMPQFVWFCERDGRTEYVNAQWSAYTGISVDSTTGGGWMRAVHPEDAQVTLERWTQCLETGKEYEVEHRIRRASDGEYRWFLVRAVPVRDARGEIQRWFGTSTDIHEQKETQAQLRAAKESLEEADRRKNEFMAMLSHELRNPLAPISNSLFILEHAPPGSEQARRALSVIERQVHHMARLIDDLLDLARITRGKVRLQHRRMDFVELTQQTVEEHRALFARAGVELQVRMTDEKLPVRGDATRLSQIVGNLLQNAAKFTPRGGRTTVTLERSGEDSVALRVEDTGAGIAPSVLARLFQPFVQAETTLDRSRGGLGLGLSLVKGLTEMHGGTVRAESGGPGRGSEFTVVLPLEASAAPEEAPPMSERRRIADRSRRVLVIEDNQDAAQTLKEALEMSDLAVDVASAGLEGIAKARKFHPDLVLCDIGLPGMDGYGVARAIRADPELRRTYLVALSGYASPEDVERSKRVGFDQHMAKPADFNALRKLIAEVP